MLTSPRSNGVSSIGRFESLSRSLKILSLSSLISRSPPVLIRWLPTEKISGPCSRGTACSGTPAVLGTLGRVPTGPVKGTAKMDADFAKVERRLVDRKIRKLEPLAQDPFAFVADLEIAAGPDSLAADGKHQRALLEGHRVQRDPRRGHPVCHQRPVELIHVPGRVATTSLLV